MRALHALLVILAVATATLPPSQLSTLDAIDAHWNLNFQSLYGSASVACNCTTLGNGTILPCLWTRPGPLGEEGFYCSPSPSNASEGILGAVAFRSFLGGIIPIQISSLSDLSSVTLINASLSGGIPDFSGLAGLTQLYLRRNSLTGAPVGLPSSLIILDLGENQISGLFPDLRSAVNLTYLRAEGNSFSGQFGSLIPSGINNIDISGNLFTGPLSGAIFLSPVNFFNLSGNDFTGPFPGITMSGSTCDLRSTSFDGCNSTLPGYPLCIISCRISTCPGARPDPIATCLNGVWVLPSVVVTGDFTATGIIVISGNYSQSSNSTLILGDGGKLVISGTATLDGALVIYTGVTEGEVVVLEAGQVEGDFTTVSVAGNEDDCQKFESQRTETSFSVLLYSDCEKSSTKRKVGLIVGCSIGAGVLILLVSVVLWKVYFFRKKIQGQNEEDPSFR